jgi:hypothetical protein
MNKKRTLTAPEPEVVDPPDGVYVPRVDETVRVAGLKGARFTFKGYGRDSGGIYAIVLGGVSGHRLERCVAPDRIVRIRRR